MSKIHSGSLSFKIPLIFTDGTAIFKKFSKQYIVHRQGFFILAPSGAGKTFFIKKQKEKHWMDGDSLWESSNAHPKGAWWLESMSTMDEIDQRSDVITVQAKKMGFWIMGASNNWLKPDAVVLPHWSRHKKFIREREKTAYDGGATSDKLGQVLDHRKWIRGWRKQGVPVFQSIDEAVAHIESIYSVFLRAQK